MSFQGKDTRHWDFGFVMTTRTEAQTIIRGISEKLAAEYAPEKVILFGSHAYGDPSASSDIDLLVIKDTPHHFIDRWVEVRRILSDPERKVPIEVLVLTPRELATRLSKGDQFIQEIVEKGRVLYAA